MKHVVGLTGTFGSGCTYIADEFIKPLGYEYIKLTDILRKLYAEKTGEKEPSRSQLQDFGNELRRDHGVGHLASLAIETINNSKQERWIVDSIRVFCNREFPSFAKFSPQAPVASFLLFRLTH